jgi:DNA (cytosine-5)-methyltransferase 1
VSAYYNEIDPYAAHWLRNLIAAGLIPDGEVDERSIEVVEAADLRQFRQCHFFAGIGGWAYAARLAGWPDDRELWTGSLPCQPYSVGGLQRGHDDPRDLWSHQIRLVRECRPLCWMGEQVAAAIGKGWLDRLFDDLEAIGYACGATVVQACAVGAPHQRDRLWAVADRIGARGEGLEPGGSAARPGQWNWRGEADLFAVAANPFGAGRWPEPLVRRMADGLPGRLDRVRAIKGYGNAIVPQVAAEVIAAYMEAA